MHTTRYIRKFHIQPILGGTLGQPAEEGLQKCGTFAILDLAMCTPANCGKCKFTVCKRKLQYIMYYMTYTLAQCIKACDIYLYLYIYIATRSGCSWSSCNVSKTNSSSSSSSRSNNRTNGSSPSSSSLLTWKKIGLPQQKQKKMEGIEPMM